MSPTMLDGQDRCSGREPKGDVREFGFEVNLAYNLQLTIRDEQGSITHELRVWQFPC